MAKRGCSLRMENIRLANEVVGYSPASPSCQIGKEKRRNEEYPNNK
jgi:hypothetical protein